MKPQNVDPDGNEVYWITITFISSDFKGEIIPVSNETTECRFFKVEELPQNIDKIDKLILADYIKQYR